MERIFEIEKGDVKVENWLKIGSIMVKVGWKGEIM